MSVTYLYWIHPVNYITIFHWIFTYDWTVKYTVPKTHIVQFNLFGFEFVAII